MAPVEGYVRLIMNSVLLKGMTRRIAIGVMAAAAALIMCPASSSADNATLKKVDNALNRWKTLDDKYTITTKDSTGAKTKLKLRMRMKATGKGNKQLTEISAPAPRTAGVSNVQDSSGFSMRKPSTGSA